MKLKFFSVKDICNNFAIHRNTFYKQTKKIMPLIKLGSKKQRQNLFTLDQYNYLCDILTNNLKKFK
jgi:ACT domain-containing protein